MINENVAVWFAQSRKLKEVLRSRNKCFRFAQDNIQCFLDCRRENCGAFPGLYLFVLFEESCKHSALKVLIV